MKYGITLFFIILFSLFSSLTYSQLCEEGYGSSSGISGINFSALWTDVDAVQGMPDDSPTSIIRFTPLTEDVNTSRIGVWDFGFDLPCNAVVTDLSFEMTRRNNADVGDIRDEEVFLKLPDFSLVSNNAAVNAAWTNQTNGWETYTYAPAGGWGVTLTPELINDPLFGFIFNVKNFSSEEGFPEIDAILMKVCYTINGTPYPSLTASITSTVDNFCSGTSNGSISIDATGGTGDFEYSIDNGANWSTTNVFAGVASNTYHLQVRDTNGACGLDLGAYYVGCASDKVLQVGDAIYSCKPTQNSNITLAIDRIQPIHDLYASGVQGVDVSSEIQTQAYSWTIDELGGAVFGVTYDDQFNIYTGVSKLYEINGSDVQADLIRIDALTGMPSVIATLPGTTGIAQVEYHSACDQLFVSNTDDGKIYRYDTSGNLLSVFDPLMVDDGVSGLAPLGERVLGLAYNDVEDRLYYSIWSNDRINNGTRNTVRSVSIDPMTCDFVVSSDVEEVVLPLISETENNARTYSHPVLDIEFNQNGNIMLLAESGFDSTVPLTYSHEARLLRYDGLSMAWSINNTPSGSNEDYRYEIGSVSDGTNALGGVDFAYAGIDGGGCTSGVGTFIAATGDALLGVDCTYNGCLYGLQYLPLEGGSPDNSVLVDLARDPGSQQKGFFGDLDIVTGCCPCACTAIDFSLQANDLTICAGDEVNICIDGLSTNESYSYAWATGEDTDCLKIYPSSTMSYAVTVTDADGCQGENNVTITVANPIEIQNIGVTDVSSCQMPNGLINVEVMGGALPLSYSIDGNITTQNNPDFSDLMPGMYMVMVTDAYGCSVAQSVTIAGPTDLSLVMIVDDQSSCNFPNGGISIAVEGGTPPFSYSIDGGATFSNSNFFSNLEGGMYAVEVIDAGGCQMMEVVEIAVPVCFGAVGDLVFEDINGDGVQDPGEPGIADVKVELYNDNGVLVSILYTDDNGNYIFDEVPAGDYYIKFIKPDESTSTLPNQSGNTSTDSNVNDSNGLGTTSIFSITSGETDLSIDYGVYTCIPVGEIIWFDVNENDLYEDYENGINGVKIEIFKDINGTWILEDLTYSKRNPSTPSDDGYYKFCVPPGRYYVRYNLPPGRFVTTVPDFGNDDTIDSDITDAYGPGTTDAFTVRSGEELCTLGGGFYLEATIGDRVWFDENQNGLREPEERGLKNIMLQAFDAAGSIIATTRSNDDGEYKLDLLRKGAYYVKVSTSQDYMVTLANKGNDETMDSDIDNSNGPNTTAMYELSPGDHMGNVDIGIVFNPLSVEWLDIEGTETPQGNLVEWTVTSEINVSHYILQRSYENTKSFINVSQVVSEYGNTSQTLYYDLTDKSYQKGQNFYRIEQHDLDGRVSYSDIIAISNAKAIHATSPTLRLYPNPNAGHFQLNILNASGSTPAQLSIFTVLGEKVYQEALETSKIAESHGAQDLQLDHLAAGIYMIEVIVGEDILIQKMTIEK